jgi:hypothetical protein
MDTVKAVAGVGAFLAFTIVIAAALMERKEPNDYKAQDQYPTYPAGNSATTPAPRVIGEHYTKPNYPGCPSKDDFDLLAKLFVQQDLDAANRFRFLHNCIPLPENRKVYIMDTALFDGLIEIRFEGETEAWWTNVEAVTH